MGETIVIIFFFILLVSLGLIAYVKLQTSNIDAQQDEQAALTATEVALKVLYLPEIQCSFENVPIHNCIDLSKMIAFTLKDPVELDDRPRFYEYYRTSELHGEYPSDSIFLLNYFDLFGYAYINLQIIVPGSDRGINHTLYSNLPDNPESVSRISTFIPVSTFNAREDEGYRYGYGILEVVSYSAGEVS